MSPFQSLATSLLLILLTASGWHCGNAQKSLKASYIGNMGVMLHTEGQAVLIDGLHRQYGPAYAFPDAEMVKGLLEGRASYGDIAAVFVTHVHGDHFHHDLMANYLRQQQTVHLVAPDQTIDSLKVKSEWNDAISERVHALRDGELEVAGITVETIPVRHSYQARHSWVENNAYRIELGAFTIVHFGDADLDDPFFSVNDEILEADVAIVPYWFLLNNESKAIWQKRIKARHIIGTHINPMISDQDISAMKSLTPNATFFKTLREEVSFD